MYDSVFESEVFDWKKLSVNKIVSNEYLAFKEKIHKYTKESFLRDECLYELSVMILGKDLSPEIAVENVHFSIKYPATTWQMFKETHKNSWWLKAFVKRFPIREIEKTQDKKVTFKWKRMLIFPDQKFAKYKDRLGTPIIITNPPSIIQTWKEETPSSHKNYCEE